MDIEAEPAEIGHGLGHANVRLHTHDHHLAGQGGMQALQKDRIAGGRKAELGQGRDAQRRELVAERGEGPAEPLGVLLGAEHAHREQPRGLEQDGRGAQQVVHRWRGHRGGEALLDVDEQQQRLGRIEARGHGVFRGGVGGRPGPRGG